MRNNYNTRQKRELLGFLEAHEFDNFSVDDIVTSMENHGEKIGRTTVYRYLESLAEQGSVRKYQSAGGITQYQHIADSDRCKQHFHMLCKSCGTLSHVDCHLIDQFAEHILKDHGFMLDSKETMLVGLCAGCRAKEAQHGAD